MNELDLVDRVRSACVEAGEPDPLDEAAVLALADRGTEGATLVTADNGFALVRDGDLVLAVAPEARGRGTGGRLAGRVAGRQGYADRAWSHQDHPAAARLAERLGWRRTRELWVMRRPVGPDAPALAALQVPDDLTVRGFADADRDPVLAVNAAAFASHPEQGALDVAGFAQRQAEAWWDPAGLLVAVDDSGSVLGFHWTKQHDDATGEVYVVGVGPAAQGRGLGRILTLAGLHRLAGLGVSEVILYVESDNEPAVRLYSGLGFDHAATDTHVQYRR